MLQEKSNKEADEGTMNFFQFFLLNLPSVVDNNKLILLVLLLVLVLLVLVLLVLLVLLMLV